MKKALLIGNDFEISEVMSNYSSTIFSFLPMVFVSKGVLGTVSINSLIKGIDLPKIKHEKPEMLLKEFDLIVKLGDVDSELNSYIDSEKIFKPRLRKVSASEDIVFRVSSYQTRASLFSMICNTVQELDSVGIKVNVSTDIKELKEPIAFIKQSSDPDFNIVFSNKNPTSHRNQRLRSGTTEPCCFHNKKSSKNILSVNRGNIYYESKRITELIFNKAKALIPKSLYVARDMVFFHVFDVNNIHLFRQKQNTYLFKSCNRDVLMLSVNLAKVANAYINHDEVYLQKATYEDLADFSRIRYYERTKTELFTTTFNFKYIKIANINDVILSYLGARKCNMACEYCFSDHEMEELPPLSKEEVVKIADYIIDGNFDINLHVDNYIGGEPSLDFEEVKSKYYDLFDYHKAYGFNTSFGYLTNAMALTEEQLIWLKDNVPYVGFSLDGDKATNDAVRHCKNGIGSYEYVVNSLDMMQKMDWPTERGISCVLTANNLNVKDLFLHFVDELKVHNVVIKPVRAPETSPIALTTKNFKELKKGYKDLFSFLYDKAKDGDISYLKCMLMPLDYAGRFFIRVFLEDRVVVKRCGSGEHIFSVGNDGCIYGCDSFNGTSKGFIADTRSGKMTDAYKVPFVTEENKSFGCNNCWARYYCGGVCQYVQYVNDYKLNSVTEFECQLAKFLIEEAIRFWTKAYEEFDYDTIKEIRNHIYNIGFKKYDNRDSFFYAPC